MKTAATLPLAHAAFHKHLEVYENFDHYTGIVTLHGLARLATKSGDPALLKVIKDALRPYISGDRRYASNFPNYFCGGNATAWMLFKGHAPEAAETVRHYADEIMNDAPRDAAGILVHPSRPDEHVIWIDVAFAVSPFLLFAGLALNEEKYIEEAFQQTAKMIRAFHVESTGLLNQSINFRGRGHRTEDHWSRGNGWAALALADLAIYLPEGHPRKKEAIQLFKNHVAACAKFQNVNGLWHQEMTEPDKSYVETSGSALMLYALGAGIKSGLIDEDQRPRLERGLQGLLIYITEECDIHNTCPGCLCPGPGTKLEYMARGPVVNDHHAFGPIVLAMGQAHLLGIETICPSEHPAVPC